MKMTTAALVEAASKGDEEAWSELVERFAGLVWSVARSHGLSEADAADVCQTTWLRLVEHLDRLRQPELVASWLVTSARRESLRTLRHSGREVPTEEIESADSDDERWPPPGSQTPDERHQALWQAFAQLTQRCRMLLRVWATASDLSYGQIATGLGIPVGSVGPTRARCLEQLRRILRVRPAAGTA